MKRWMVAAVAGLAVVGGLLGAPGSAQASSGAWYQFYRPNVRGSFYQTAAISRNNIWSVGDTWTAAGENTYKPFIRHYDGRSWKAVKIPGTPGFTNAWVSASSAKNVWVSGFRWSGKKQLVAAYRWNGTAWHPVKMPHPVNNAGPSVTAVSASDVWIGYETTSSQKALHWDGSAWHTVAVPNYGNNVDIVPDGKGGYWFGAQASLTGKTWVERPMPAFSGGFGGVTRIPGTTSFLVNAGAAIGDETDARPTLYRFDL